MRPLWTLMCGGFAILESKRNGYSLFSERGQNIHSNSVLREHRLFPQLTTNCINSFCNSRFPPTCKRREIIWFCNILITITRESHLFLQFGKTKNGPANKQIIIVTVRFFFRCILLTVEGLFKRKSLCNVTKSSSFFLITGFRMLHELQI